MTTYGSNHRGTQNSEQNCRTCTDFKSWAKQQRKAFFSAGGEPNESQKRRDDCPLDKDELGRATWSLLHTIGATYPEKPTSEQKKDVKNFFDILGNLYPCSFCADDLRKDLVKEPVDTSSQEALSQWICRLHNRVNKKLGKPIFDCSKVNERWRDGWLDGSCD